MEACWLYSSPGPVRGCKSVYKEARMWGTEKIAGRRWKMRKRSQLFATVSHCKNDLLGISCQTKKVTGKL